MPDVFQHFEHSVIKLVVWRPNETRKPIRIEFYEGGVKKKELKHLFYQEMAEDPKSCFLASGNPFFNNKKIEVLDALHAGREVIIR